MKLESQANPPILFELRPDRNLLDPNFQSYKLSLDPLPIYTLPIDSGIDTAQLTDAQYSLQHVKISAMSNHILSDPWNENSVYIVDSQWNVLRISILADKTRTTKKVWSIPESENGKKAGRFNVTLKFPDMTHAVLSNGIGELFILDTGARNTLESTDAQWKILSQSSPFSSKVNRENVLIDSVIYCDENNICLIDCLLIRIDERGEWNDFLEFHQDPFLASNDHSFVTVLEWITLTQDGNNESWCLKSSRSLLGRSGINYGAIELNGEGVHVAAESPFYFAYDSQNEIKNTLKTITSHHDKCDYIWHQTPSEVKILFRLPEESNKSDFLVEINPSDIKIEYKNEGMLQGKLSQVVKPDKSTWTLESGKLEITLSKSEEGSWSEIVEGSTGGEEIDDPQLIQQIHSQFMNMCSDKWGSDPHKSDVYDPQQFEECDIYHADSALLMRIDRKLQRITHQGSLGSHEWLFNVQMSPGTLPCICLRHDVDGIIWEFQLGEWKHRATFLALGYVQASKETRKFTLSPPDLSYAAICDLKKHVHIYRQPSGSENVLRNRKTGEEITHVSRQQIISIEPSLELLGAYGASNYLILLTHQNIHFVQMTLFPQEIN